jgi:hypothetical protein
METNNNGAEKEYNALAVEIAKRGLGLVDAKDPVPEWAHGLRLPLVDLYEVLDFLRDWYKKRGVELAPQINAMKAGLRTLANAEGLIQL